MKMSQEDAILVKNL